VLTLDDFLLYFISIRKDLGQVVFDLSDRLYFSSEKVSIINNLKAVPA